MSKLESVNPYNNEKLMSYSLLTDKEVYSKIDLAQKAFLEWRGTTMNYRSSLMRKLAEVLKSEKQVLGILMSSEMGKPLKQAIAEVEKCAWVCNYYADNAVHFLKDKEIETDASHSYVRYNPLGVVLAIMPWNYPLWQYFRFAAPNFMAGNVGLLKHASNVPGSALAIEELFVKAGFPQGVSQTLLIKSDKVKAVLEHSTVQAVTLTGSEAAGSAVAEQAGKLIKKSVLELGGTNAIIVFNDADLDAHMETIVNARFQNTGQSCIAGKRFLVQSEIFDAFLSRFTKEVKTLRLENPLNDDCDLGPMATESLAEELEEQMNKSLNKGAVLHFGGNREGAKFQPTILTEVTPEMEVFKEETFGPLAAITRFDSEDEAIVLNNKSELGLGVAIFTKSMERVNRMIDLMDEGAVFVNELVKSDPRLPFGGVKKSGFGRELSEIGCLEFVNRKTVYIK